MGQQPRKENEEESEPLVEAVSAPQPVTQPQQVFVSQFERLQEQLARVIHSLEQSPGTDTTNAIEVMSDNGVT